MLNVIGMCRLVADPELKEVGQTCVATFRVVTNEYRKMPDGKSQQTPHYFEAKAWDTGARRLVEQAKKGDKIYVEGVLRQESWKDADGNPRSKNVVRVGRFEVQPRGAQTSDVETEPSNEEVTV